MAKKRNGRNGKIKKNNAQEKRIEQKLFRLMPALPKLLRRIRQRIENFDLKQPKTFMADLEGDFTAFEQTLQRRARWIGRLLWFLLGKAALNIQAGQVAHETIANLKKLASDDERYSLLLKLMYEADQRVSFVSMFVFFLHGDPRTSWFLQCAPMDLLEQAERETNEARATTVLRALHEVSEFLYKPYLFTLWALSYIKEGQLPPQPPEFGELVKQLHRRLADYPGLVEPDAGWMRNSAVHNMPDHVRDGDSVWMWDRNHERALVRVDDLLEMVQRMYLISGITITRVSQLYMFRDFFVRTGLFNMFVGLMPLVFSRDEARLSAAEKEMQKRAKTLFEPMETFFGFRI